MMRFHSRILPFVFSISLLPCASASAKTIYVDRNATGAKNGTSWADAYTVLTSAVTSAVSGDEVWIAKGTYRPNDLNPSDLSRALSFKMKTGVAIRGGFAGWETSTTQRDVPNNPVVLTGDLLGNDSAANTMAASTPDTRGDNVYHVFDHSTISVGTGAVLDSVTIRGGNANDAPSVTYGGAIYIASSSSPSLVNCTLVDNTASQGGAIYQSVGNLELRSCTIAFNSTTSLGGGLRTAGGYTTIYNSTITHNSASAGGGIMNYSDLRLFNCSLCYNESPAPKPGGNPPCSGIRCVFGYGGSTPVTLTNCILWGNLHEPQILSLDVTATNCIVQNGLDPATMGPPYFTLTNISLEDPLIVPFGNYGGPTWTVPTLPGSPAIDMGVATSDTTDQRGFPRPIDGDDDSSAIIDIGATEYTPAADLPAFWCLDFDNDGSPFGTEYALGTNPLVADSGDGLSLAITSPGGPATLTFGRNPAADAHATWVLERSPDLSSGSFAEIFRFAGPSGTATHSGTSSTILPDSFEIVDPTPPTGRAFYRLGAIYEP